MFIVLSVIFRKINFITAKIKQEFPTGDPQTKTVTEKQPKMCRGSVL